MSVGALQALKIPSVNMSILYCVQFFQSTFDYVIFWNISALDNSLNF